MLTVSDCAQKNYQLVLFLSKVLRHQNCTHEQLYVLLFKCKIRFHLSLNHSWITRSYVIITTATMLHVTLTQQTCKQCKQSVSTALHIYDHEIST